MNRFFRGVCALRKSGVGHLWTFFGGHDGVKSVGPISSAIRGPWSVHRHRNGAPLHKPDAGLDELQQDGHAVGPCLVVVPHPDR